MLAIGDSEGVARSDFDSGTEALRLVEGELLVALGSGGVDAFLALWEEREDLWRCFSFGLGESGSLSRSFSRSFVGILGKSRCPRRLREMGVSTEAEDRLLVYW